MKKLTLFFVLCLFYCTAQSQICLEGAVSSGVFLPQQDIAAAWKKDFPYPYSYSFGLSKQAGNGPDWAVFYNNPRYGAQVMLLSLDKSEEIGRIYALQPFVRFSFLKQRYLLNPGLRLAAGVGYITKTIEPGVTNPALGSRWNAVGSADFDVEIRSSQRLHLRTSLGVMHLSDFNDIANGINMLTATIGLGYVFGEASDTCFPSNNFKKKDRDFVNPKKGKRVKKEKGGQDCF